MSFIIQLQNIQLPKIQNEDVYNVNNLYLPPLNTIYFQNYTSTNREEKMLHPFGQISEDDKKDTAMNVIQSSDFESEDETYKAFTKINIRKNMEEDSDYNPDEEVSKSSSKKNEISKVYEDNGKQKTLLNKRDSPAWEENYNKLFSYYQQNGNIKLKKRADPKLAQWIVNQRANRRYNILSPSRIAKLNAIGMDWNPRRQSSVSTPRKKLPLKEKIKRRRPCDESDDDDFCPEPRSKEVKNHSKSDSELNDFESEELLDNVYKAFSSLSELKEYYKPKDKYFESTQSEVNNFLITEKKGDVKNEPLVQPDNPQWEDHFKKLQRFYIQNGHIKVQKKLDIKLAQWIVNQRASYRNGQLSASRISKLESLGIDWDPRSISKETKDAKQTTTDITLPQTKTIQTSSSPMSISKLLNALPNSKPTDDPWMISFETLKEFKIKNGHFNVPRNMQALSYWTFNQRGLKKRGLLSVEKEHKLNSIGFIWDVHQQTEEKKELKEETNNRSSLETDSASSFENIFKSQEETTKIVGESSGFSLKDLIELV